MRWIIGFAIGLLSIQAAVVMKAGNALADEIAMPYFEDFEDEVLSEDEVDLEKDMDELTLDEEDEVEEQGSSLSNDK